MLSTYIACVAWLLPVLKAGAQAGSSDEICWSAIEAGRGNDGRFDPARNRMRQAIIGGAVASMAAAVAMDGRIIWEEACGWADKERRLRATPHNPYNVGSISKTFTATGFMILAERGLVDLSHPANDYLGRAKLTSLGGDASQATVRRLMHHTSGLPLHAQVIYDSEAYRRPSMDETILRYGIIVRPPGEAYNYANLGYGIVEHIISRVVGVSYEDFMRREVFGPLGLTHTAVGPVPELREITVALYHNGARRPGFDMDQRGAGYIFSSAHDLVRFGQFHLKDHLADQRQILKDSTIDVMVEDVTQTPGGPYGGPGGDPSAYGLAWVITPNGAGSGLRTVYHHGSMPGVTALLKLIPARRLAVAVLANTQGAPTNGVSDDVIAALVPEFTNQRARPAPARPSAPQPTFQPSTTLVGTWRGTLKTWSADVPVEMEIRSDGDVHISMPNSTPGLRGQLRALVSGVGFASGEFRGYFPGTIPTEDASRDRHSIILDRLVLRGDTLSGTALADGGPHFALPSWIKLVRQPR